MAQYAAILALANATNKKSEFFDGLLGGTTAVSVIYAGNVTMKSNLNVSGVTTLGGDTQIGKTTTSKLGFYGSSGTIRQTLGTFPSDFSNFTGLHHFVGSLKSVLTGVGLIA
jgi:hypothetical protein